MTAGGQSKTPTVDPKCVRKRREDDGSTRGFHRWASELGTRARACSRWWMEREKASLDGGSTLGVNTACVHWKHRNGAGQAGGEANTIKDVASSKERVKYWSPHSSRYANLDRYPVSVQPAAGGGWKHLYRDINYGSNRLQNPHLDPCIRDCCHDYSQKFPTMTQQQLRAGEPQVWSWSYFIPSMCIFTPLAWI